MVRIKPNIVFVLLDGVRVDRLGISTEFQEVSKNGTLLNNVSTAIPYTVGAVNAIFSGLYGKENGIDAYYKMLRLKDSIKVLQEVLQENDYFTACDLLHDKIITKRNFNIHQAHDEFSDDLLIRHPEFLKNVFEKSDKKPVFCFLHFTKIHTITVSEVIKKFEWDDKNFYKNVGKNMEQYDNVFQETGIYAKKIVNTIKELGKENNTIIVFFSDHGTGVGERFGERNYGSFTYEETIRTFVLFLGKNIIQDRVTDVLRSSIDIYPTTLDLCGIKHDFERPGESFANYLLKDTKIDEKEYTFSETGALQGPHPSPKEPNVFCIKTPRYKLMYLRTINEWRFYDLKTDKKEQQNISGKGLAIEKELKKKLLEWINR